MPSAAGAPHVSSGVRAADPASGARTARGPSATSGPGRGPASDGRARSRHVRSRARRGRATAETVRLRAENLFPAPDPDLDPFPAPFPAPLPGPRPPHEAPPQGRRVGSPGEGAPRAPGPQWAWKAVPAELSEERGAPEGGAERQPDPDGQAAGGPSRRERARLAVRERLPVWLQARCGLERRGVVALVVVLAVAAVFAAQHFWAGRTQPVRPPDVVREAGGAHERGAEPAPSPGSAPAEGGTNAGGGVAATGAQSGGVVVDVSGKVRHPGVQRLPAGSRVADALRAAGGVRPGADLSGLNRARVLLDGEQVVVGTPAASAAPGGPGAGSGGAAGAGGAAAGGAAAGAAATGPVGLNTASAAQLDELPGVGPVLAQHIIDYRTEHGGFRSVDELREVNGIGDRRFADLQDLVRP
ncbi:helix-hairpin-helix domain-containing protein [Streptomyces sp. NPDC050703]|uniref:helix-hairpin-helix domain-containing protein n=1 Tax=Streptomyces sp. NPDC050703 TaxID=3157218 RepID=UPI0034167097